MNEKQIATEIPAATTMLERAAEAEAAGFTAAAEKLRAQAKRFKQLHAAYQGYRFVTQEVVDRFNAKLKEKTSRPATEQDRLRLSKPTVYFNATVIHDQMTLVALEAYPNLPPSEALKAVGAARAAGIFDRFEVAEVNPVSTQVKLPDPIVFGLVDGCSDRFFITEWGSDVSIKDLIDDAR